MIQFNKKTKEYEILNWVLKAVAQIEVGPYELTCLHITTTYIEAADGHRAHRVNNFGLESGFYEIRRNDKSIIIIEKRITTLDYPDTDKIFNQSTESNDHIQDNFIRGYAWATRTISWDSFINPKYVEDVFSNGKSYSIETSVVAKKPVFFNRQGYKAVIMPMEYSKC
jgi:hypothetical protein